MRVLELAAAWTVVGPLVAWALFPDAPEGAWERWQARKRAGREAGP